MRLDGWEAGELRARAQVYLLEARVQETMARLIRLNAPGSDELSEKLLGDQSALAPAKASPTSSIPSRKSPFN